MNRKTNTSFTSHSLLKTCVFQYWGKAIVILGWIAICAINISDSRCLKNLPGRRFLRFSGQDFDQYYAAGVAVREGLWDELYPDPSHFVKGIRPANSPYRPAMHSALQRRGATEQTKNIYPPPTAFLFWPLALFGFQTARLLFFAALVAGVIGCVNLLRKECDEFGISPTTSGILEVMAGLGPPMLESVSNGNVSVFICLSVFFAMRGIRRNHVAKTVAGFLVAGLTKGFAAVWVPALFLWKQWRTVVVGAVVGGFLLIVATLLGCGIGPWREYISDVLPVSRNYLRMISDGNLCLPSFFAWTFHWEDWTQIPPGFSRLLTTAKWAVYVLAYGLGAKAAHRNRTIGQALSLCAVTLAFQTFSTISWSHYAVNAIPFLPAAFAASRGSRLSRSAILAGYALCWFPIGNAAKYMLGIPVLGYGRLFGYLTLIVCSLAIMAFGMSRHDEFESSSRRHV